MASYGLEILIAIDARKEYEKRSETFINDLRMALLSNNPEAGTELFPEYFTKESTDAGPQVITAETDLDAALDDDGPTEWIFTDESLTEEKAMEWASMVMGGNITITPDDLDDEGWQ